MELQITDRLMLIIDYKLHTHGHEDPISISGEMAFGQSQSLPPTAHASL